MKRNFFRMIAVAGILAGGCLSASAAERLVVNVPFSFVMGGLEFQPGYYTLDESNNGVLTVYGEGHGAMVITVPSELSKTGNAASSLHFIKDGHTYHLVGYQAEGTTGRAIDTPTEHKLLIGTR